MPRSVFIATASAAAALAMTALLATPSMGMSLSHYDGTAGPFNAQAGVGTLFDNRLAAENRKREREAAWLRELRRSDQGVRALPVDAVAPVAFDAPFSLTFPVETR